MEVQLRGKPFTTVLKLKQVWDSHNENYVNEHNKQITGDGELSLWRAIDRSIWFADKVVFNGPHDGRRNCKFNNFESCGHRHNYNKNYNVGGRKLPPPPQ